ncbi:MAG TPA: efflux RND transporter periplasmic adaptor subunit [Kofleriaceae bacterium]|nr:efflux RND transporter periplasmic adaptor subunit [Kofleriaceae bacterium]
MSTAAAPPIGIPGIEPEVARTLRLGRGPRIRRLVVRLGLALAGALIVLAIGRAWWRRGEQPPPTYTTAPAVAGELQLTVTATGTLEARNLVEIGSEVSGRVARVKVDANDPVTRGEILAELDPTTFQAQAAQATAALAQARAQVVQARASQQEAATTRQRTAGLFAAGVVSAQERDSAEAAAARADAALVLAQATVAQAAAALDVARTNLSRTAIRTPIDGMVLERSVEVGQTVVSAFQAQVLFRIAEDLRAMKVSVDVDEADVGLVAPGQHATFTVAAYLDRTFDARVVTVHNAAHLVDRVVSYEAELEVDNHDLALRPGMTVTAQIAARRLPDALLVPNQALRFQPAGVTRPDDAGPRVWILDGGLPRAVPVQVRGASDTRTAITGPGLAAGAAVIVDAR